MLVVSVGSFPFRRLFSSYSQWTIFVANAAASAKRSVWLSRRAAVLREGVDTKEVTFEKIGDPDNVANYYTKPVTTMTMNQYFSYTHPKPTA